MVEGMTTYTVWTAEAPGYFHSDSAAEDFAAAIELVALQGYAYVSTPHAGEAAILAAKAGNYTARAHRVYVEVS